MTAGLPGKARHSVRPLRAFHCVLPQGHQHREIAASLQAATVAAGKDGIMGTTHTGNATRSAFDRLVEQEWASLTPALQECGEIAVTRLAQALSDAVANAAGKMFEQANQAITPAERERWLTAADLARAIRINLGHDFSRYFQAKYCHACKYPRIVRSEPGGTFEGADLRVTEQNTLGGEVADDFIKQFSQFVARDSLQRVGECFNSLLDVELEPGYVPIGPRALSAALSDTFKIQPGSPDAKQRLLRTMHADFLVRVNLLYRDMTSFMIALGYQPAALQARVRHVDALRTAATIPEMNLPGMACPEPGSRTFLSDPVSASPAENRQTASPLVAKWSLGDLIEYRQSEQTTRQLCLTWISPMQSLYLWTTAESRRALCVSSEELSTLFASGQIRRLAAPDTAEIHSAAIAAQQKLA